MTDIDKMTKAELVKEYRRLQGECLRQSLDMKDLKQHYGEATEKIGKLTVETAELRTALDMIHEAVPRHDRETARPEIRALYHPYALAAECVEKLSPLSIAVAVVRMSANLETTLKRADRAEEELRQERNRCPSCGLVPRRHHHDS